MCGARTDAGGSQARQSGSAWLTEAEAGERLSRHGPNITGAAGGDSLWVVLGRQLASPLIAVLLVCGAVALALVDAADAAVVFGVVAANTALGFVQEWRAGWAMAAAAALTVLPVVELDKWWSRSSPRRRGGWRTRSGARRR